MTAIPGRLFGGGAPATGVACEVVVDAAGLQVRSSNAAYQVTWADLQLREVGTGKTGLEFSWPDAAGPMVLQVFDDAALRSLRAHPALARSKQMEQLLANERRNAWRRGAGWTLVAAFVLLPVLLIALFFWQADRIVGVLAERVPIAEERQLGDEVFASMRGTLQLVETGPAVAAVQQIGARLTQNSRYAYRFHVARNPAINAFALPGGIIVVHTGLIEATRAPEELAGVLAHEVQHVELRHSLRALIKDLGWRGLWAMLSGDVGGTLAGLAVVELGSLRFSRDAEREADVHGFAMLVDERIDPRGMVDFFNTLAEREGNATPPPLLATHPSSASRRAALEAKVAELHSTAFDALHLGAWPPVID